MCALLGKKFVGVPSESTGGNSEVLDVFVESVNKSTIATVFVI